MNPNKILFFSSLIISLLVLVFEINISNTFGQIGNKTFDIDVVGDIRMWRKRTKNYIINTKC